MRGGGAGWPGWVQSSGGRDGQGGGRDEGARQAPGRVGEATTAHACLWLLSGHSNSILTMPSPQNWGGSGGNGSALHAPTPTLLHMPLPPQNWDGSGGTGSALRHFQATGSKYPLAVKLGTITPHGADVYRCVCGEGNV